MRLIWGAYALRSMRTNSDPAASSHFRILASFSIFRSIEPLHRRALTTSNECDAKITWTFTR
jgi:hypothetical protein